MAKINPRTKGATGEREVADMLNLAIYQVMKRLGYSEPECLKGFTHIQRNSLQSAVGGADLVNTLGLAIEIKRQEALNLDAWWQQVTAAANRSGDAPVLIYRQNRKAWRVRMQAAVYYPGSYHPILADFSKEDFLQWFALWVESKVTANFGELK